MLLKLKDLLDSLYNFLKFKKYRYNNSRKNFYISKEELENKDDYILRNLKKKGYVVIKNYLSKQKCDEIKDLIDNFINNRPDLIWTDKDKSDFRINGAENISDAIASLELNNFTRMIGSKYLSQDLILFMIMANKTIFKANNEGSGGGWHKDSNADQFKSILYLNDVGESNGPFELLEKSNTDLLSLQMFIKLKKRFSNTRFSSNEIGQISNEQKKDIIKIKADAGTLIMVNTSMIHRGSPLKKGVRYAITNYFYSKNKFSNYEDHFEKRIKTKII